MKRMVMFFGVLAVSATFAGSGFAACTLNLAKEDLGRGRSWELSWTPQAGAQSYTLESIRQAPNGTTSTRRMTVEPRSGTKIRKEVSVQSTVPLTVTYRVTVVGGTEPCSASIDVSYPTDSTLQQAVRKSVIPLVGSARGANGSDFKTSLRLRATGPRQSGILVFHPANQPASDTDPFLVYNLPGTASTANYDDVVAAFGVSGLGSIDIIPEFDQSEGWKVPSAEVRLFNVAPEGTYGTIEAQTQAHDFLGGNVEPIEPLTVTIPTPDLRVNLAVRSFEPTVAEVQVLRNGSIISMKPYDLTGDFLLFNSADNIAGIPLQPGDVVTIRMPDGGGVPMYTLTDNHTNDPALFMPPVRIRYDVGTWDVGF
jgi:hypothetical protein